MNFSIKKDCWNQELKSELNKAYFHDLTSFLEQEYHQKIVFPPIQDVFRVFNECPFNHVKVVILGQDPYHGMGQANGLSFSVPKGVKHPPSLRNIFKERESDLGISYPYSGDLLPWVKQGVLLLNTTLTVESSKAGSHQNQGWEIFTDFVIKLLSDKKEKLIFVLWGAAARKKGRLVDLNKHKIVESAHPSPLSVYRGFWDSEPFSKVNAQLSKFKIDQIDWANE